jgi:hypothetical protein
VTSFFIVYHVVFSTVYEDNNGLNKVFDSLMVINKIVMICIKGMIFFGVKGMQHLHTFADMYGIVFRVIMQRGSLY